MLLVVLVALLILIVALSVHYSQHFRFKFARQRRPRKRARRVLTNDTHDLPIHSPSSPTRFDSPQYKICCCGTLKPINGENFDFFPISFILYLSFLIWLCLLIIVLRLLRYFNHHKQESIYDLIFGYSVELSQWRQHRQTNDMSHISTVNGFDYILIYGVLILSVWASLFSFYRYYTTLVSTVNLREVSTKKLFSKFSVFAFMFCALFMLQIHVWYYMWFHWILFGFFNIYCTYKFNAMLIKQYNIFMTLAMSDVMHTNEKILKSVKFTTNTSIICCILQSVNLSIFAMTYNVNVLYYLPILWSISAFILSLNFIRNRRFLLSKLQCIYPKFKSKPVSPFPLKTPKNSPNNSPKPSPINGVTKEKPPNIDVNVTPNAYIHAPKPLTQSKSAEIGKIRLNKSATPIPQTRRARSSPTVLDEIEIVLEMNALSTADTTDSDTPDKPFKLPIISVEMSVKVGSRQKAFGLLGITTPTENNDSYVTFGDMVAYLTKENIPTPEPTSLHLNMSEQHKFEMSDTTTFGSRILHALPTNKHTTKDSMASMDEMLASMDVLAGFGFCTKKSILSLRLVNVGSLNAMSTVVETPIPTRNELLQYTKAQLSRRYGVKENYNGTKMDMVHSTIDKLTKKRDSKRASLKQAQELAETQTHDGGE